MIVYSLPPYITRYFIIMSVRRIVYGPKFPPSDPQNTVLESGQLLMEHTTYGKF
jgi:hypothetical protein